MADAGALVREQADLLVVDVHGVGVPDVLSHPNRATPYRRPGAAPDAGGCSAPRRGFRQMCMQLDAIVPRHLRPTRASVRRSPKTASMAPARSAASSLARSR
jgi:hypothetical protein